MKPVSAAPSWSPAPDVTKRSPTDQGLLCFTEGAGRIGPTLSGMFSLVLETSVGSCRDQLVEQDKSWRRAGGRWLCWGSASSPACGAEGGRDAFLCESVSSRDERCAVGSSPSCFARLSSNGITAQTSQNHRVLWVGRDL